MIAQSEEGHIVVQLGNTTCWKNGGVTMKGEGFVFFENRNSETMEGHKEGAKVYLGFKNIQSVEDTIETLSKIKQMMVEFAAKEDKK